MLLTVDLFVLWTMSIENRHYPDIPAPYPFISVPAYIVFESFIQLLLVYLKSAFLLKTWE